MNPSLKLTHDGLLSGPAFVVLGEGLAAGMGSFSLSSDTQKVSFPAFMAAQMGVQFSQPLIQPPGIGGAIGFAPAPSILPSAFQSTVLEQMPPDPPANLSVPWLTLADAVRKAPRQPLIHRGDSRQTLLNLLVATRDIYFGAKDPFPTVLDTAVNRKPTLALVELGYTEALLAATSADPSLLPASQSFREDYRTAVSRLRGTGAVVVVLTIPDPLDTAYFSTIAEAAKVLKIDPSLVPELWRTQRDDLITANGLNEMSFQIFAAATGVKGMAEIGPLPEGVVLSNDVAMKLRAGVVRLNEVIRCVANDTGALLFDLNKFLKDLRTNGATVGSKHLTGGYLGGFYSMNGYYPGATGHALIANGILDAINRGCGSSFAPVNLAPVLAADPVADYRGAQGPDWTRATLSSPPPIPAPPVSAVGTATKSALQQKNFTPTPPSVANPLRLPPGLEQVLDVNPHSSFFGDALSAQNCTTPATIQWGSGMNFFFGGFSIMDSHLSGKIRIKFTPPIDNWTTFAVSFESGLSGTDATLASPSFFKMPGRRQSVSDVPGQISTGKLNLTTGWLNSYDSQSGSITLFGSFFNTALFALLRVVPNFPKTPLSFPGQYGSAFVRFEQRPDGLLDFTLNGSTFVPLGEGARFPLNFCSASWDFASVPAAGTILHPRISVTTCATPPQSDPAPPCEIPYNTVQEFTLVSSISSFGDQFTLDAPQLGGHALGRSRLLGRAQIQYGLRSGDSVPFIVHLCGSGGLFAPLNPTPIAALFPGAMLPGPEGFGTTLRFPLRSYPLDDLSIADDTFDISVGALDVKTGELIHPLIHRSFINQDLIYALLRVEPLTPKASFYFRGPGSFKKARRKESLFRSFTQCHLPYPAGLKFPDPNFATGFAVSGTALDPYVWMWATQDRDGVDVVRSASAQRIISGKGELVSYRFTVSGDPRKRRPEFHYENHSQNASFTMHSLAWIGFGNSGMDVDGDYDVVSFSCFGLWRSLRGKDTIVQASVQMVRSPKAPWVGIQIARAVIGDADTTLPDDFYPIPTLGPG